MLRSEQDQTMLSTKPEDGAPSARATLTICICTVDRPDPLRACLQSIASGELRPDQVLVSDDSRSPQATEAVCSAFDFVTYLEGPRRGLCANRNSVIARATSTHVSLVDDDAVVGPDFVSRAIDHANNDVGRVIVTGSVLEGGTRLVLPGASDFCGHFTYGPRERTWWNRLSGRFETIHLNSNLFPRAAFDVAQFDELIQFGFEDMDLCSHLLAQGYRIEWDPKMINSHYPPPRTEPASWMRWRNWTRARYYTSLKRYFLWSRRPHLGLAYLLIAPVKIVLHSAKVGEWAQISPTPGDMLIAIRLFLKFRRQSARTLAPGS